MIAPRINLNGKGVIITGASKGLGAVCARALAKEGASLVLISRSPEKLEEVRKSCENPDKHISISVDLYQRDQLEFAILKAQEFLGNVDVVLHVIGGGLGLHDPFISSEGLDKLLILNLKIPVEINKLVLPKMIECKKGNLVHIGSIASYEAVASLGYNTAKAALAAYVRSLGKEVAKNGIMVTGILPGGFYAPGNSWERLKKNKPEIVEQFSQKLPRGFLGKAEELIPMILLLCSEDASMMGGCMVPMDAGQGNSYLM